ncbi:hypothetical protein [Ammoniphilus resinae]|uniref:Uncharacterized protein n=1 Tax=Ammoniphilus resinae TaxID=861532 RepID=A0ABS4GLJ9_9BACL|nr:hypothetical protein [Ammoniphilus resinae]MBP1931151.1 hypothetical protein [Ammoniphilus resinae]
MKKHEAHAICRRYKNYWCTMRMRDGRVYTGVIDDVDHDHVYLLVPRDDWMRESPEKSKKDQRQFYDYGYGYGYPSYYPESPYYGGYYPYPPYPYYPRRRFRRIALPLAFLTGIALGRRFF